MLIAKGWKADPKIASFCHGYSVKPAPHPAMLFEFWDPTWDSAKIILVTCTEAFAQIGLFVEGDE